MLLVVLGFAILATVMVDALLTTVAVSTVAGPLTGNLTHGLWTLALRRRSHRFLRMAGPVIALTAVAVWFAALWLGWSLVFLADTDAVVSATSGRPAGGWDRVYFAGSTLFTLGGGEFIPQGVVWQMLAIVALVNGLTMVTLWITYLIPVTGATTGKRRLAASIASLGERPDAILMSSWDGRGFAPLEPYLVSLTPMVAELAEQHLAYPVLHYFHSAHRYTAAAPMMASLDEALTMLEFGVAPRHRPAQFAFHPLRDAVSHFLDTLFSAFIIPETDPPAAPSLQRLRDTGIPTVDDEEFETAVSKLGQRRRLLHALVDNDGWSWDDLWTTTHRDHDNPAGTGMTA
ncbi:MAG: potassium channel family protein [Actinomycetota bacterium]|nr:potassium channel family protein [Actinomycetota bacterium]